MKGLFCTFFFLYDVKFYFFTTQKSIFKKNILKKKVGSLLGKITQLMDGQFAKIFQATTLRESWFYWYLHSTLIFI